MGELFLYAVDELHDISFAEVLQYLMAMLAECTQNETESLSASDLVALLET